LTFREGHYICEAIAETGCLVALDIMVRPGTPLGWAHLLIDVLRQQEVNPTLGDERSVAETVAIGCSLARAALGETLL
jgi:arginase